MYDFVMIDSIALVAFITIASCIIGFVAVAYCFGLDRERLNVFGFFFVTSFLGIGIFLLMSLWYYTLV